MKRILYLMSLVIPLTFFGCGSGVGVENVSGEDEAGITGLAITGSGLTSDALDESEADVNSAIAKAVADKVEVELNALMEDEAFDEEILAADDPGYDSADATKSFRVGLGSRGITVFMENEKVPFAGGEMLLNGDIGLRLRFKPGSKIEVVASGQLVAGLKDVLREGYIKEIPYSLALNGANTLELEGTFGITIKAWRVSAISTDLQSAIVDSDVVAIGTIADKSVQGAVDMVDVGIRMVNPDILHSPKANKLTCSGSIKTKINDSVLGLCDIAESCLGCK